MEVVRDVQHRRHQPVQRLAVAADLGAELQALAHAHDRHAVHPEVTADDDPVAGAGPVGANVDPVGDHPDAGGVDVDPVAVAALDDLRVARDDPDARTLRRVARRCATAPTCAISTPSSRMKPADR